MPDATVRAVPAILADWLRPFQSAFTAPTWQHAMVLIMGAILVPGRRTVASALRVTGLDQTTGTLDNQIFRIMILQFQSSPMRSSAST